MEDIEGVIEYLSKRRLLMMKIVALIFILSLVFNFYFSITPLNYFDGQYNFKFVYGLMAYKFIELIILYYILFFRYKYIFEKNILNDELLKKFKKHVKLLLFLVPQGNVVFGIISYKLTGEIVYLLFFLIVAITTIYNINPKSNIFKGSLK